MNSTIKVQKMDDLHWKVVIRPIEKAFEYDFQDAVEEMEKDPYSAEEDFLYVLEKCDNTHIGSLIYLGRICNATDRMQEGYKFIKQAYDISMSAFPASFNFTSDLLLWEHVENRQLLSALVAMAHEFIKRHEYQEALEILKLVLAINPPDNQGVKLLLPECYLFLRRYEDLLADSSLNTDDASPDSLYAMVFAYFKLGNFDAAKEKLGEAKSKFPLVAEELNKVDHVFPDDEQTGGGGLSVGSRKEAFFYWFRMRELWSPEADLLAFIAS